MGGNMSHLTPQQMKEYIKNEWRLHRKTLYRRFIDQPADRAIGSVIIIHGYRGHIRAPHFKDLANSFDDAGFNVVSCDLPGFGKSAPFAPGMEGQVLWFGGLVRITKLLLYHVLISREKSEKPVFLIGYSLGALVIVRMIQIYMGLQRHIHGVILISVPMRVDHNARKEILRLKVILKPLFGLIARFRPKMPVASYEPDEFSMDDMSHFKGDMNAWTAFQILKASENARARPKRIHVAALFVHGKEDTVAPLADMEWTYGQIATPAADKEKKVYEAIDHLVLQKHRTAITDIVNWAVMRTKIGSTQASIYPHVGLIEIGIRGLWDFLISAGRQFWFLVWSEVISEWLRRAKATCRIWFRGTK